MLSVKIFLQFNFTLLLLSLSFFQTTYGEDANITIPLNKTISWANKELYGGSVIVYGTKTLQVNFGIPNKDISYIIFQVHSYLYNVTLYRKPLIGSNAIVGTNIGLYSAVKPAVDTFYIYNENFVDMKLYISVHGYDKKDPIPGGCNMEFANNISPYLQIYNNKDSILVDIAPPRDIKDTSCTSPDDVTVAFYMIYTQDSFYNVESYFDGIRTMLTLDNIVNSGEFVPDNGERMRRRLAAYPGKGAVHVAVAYSATNKSAYSLYVPAVTYGCNPLREEECDVMGDTLSRILCVALFFMGMLLCFFGHSFFKTEMFLVGSISGVIVTYIVISLIADVAHTALLGASVLSGACFGAIWLLFWWFYGIPLFSVFLATLNVGFLFAAIVYFCLPGGLVALQMDLNFWTLFILITFLTSLMLVSTTFLSNILCCAVLGSYAVAFSADCGIGATLKYIVVNTVRRAVVPKFNRAILAPPFGWREALVAALWATLAGAGFLAQHYRHRGRPPFPPPPRSVRRAAPAHTYGAIFSRVTTRDDFLSTLVNTPTGTNERAPLLA